MVKTMTKREFLNELESKLLILDADERDDIIVEHMHHISDLVKNGKTEEEAVKSFGDVSVLASELLKAYNIEYSDTTSKSTTTSAKNMTTSTVSTPSNSQEPLNTFESSYESAKSVLIKPVVLLNRAYEKLTKSFDDVYKDVSLDDRFVGNLSRATATVIVGILYLVVFITLLAIFGNIVNGIGLAFFEVIFGLMTAVIFFSGILYAVPVIKHIATDFSVFYFNKYVTREIVKEAQISIYKDKPSTLAYVQNDEHYAVYVKKELKEELVIKNLRQDDVNYEITKAECERLKLVHVRSLQRDAIKRIEKLGKVTAKVVKDSNYKEELKQQKQDIKEATKLQKAEAKVAASDGEIRKVSDEEMSTTTTTTTTTTSFGGGVHHGGSEQFTTDIYRMKVEAKQQKILLKQQRKLAKQQVKMASYGDSRAIEIEIKEAKKQNKQSSGLDTTRSVLSAIFMPVSIAIAIATTVSVIAMSLLVFMGLGNIGFTLLSISVILLILGISSIIKLLIRLCTLKPIKIRSVVWETILITSAALLALFAAKLAGYPGFIDLIQDYVIFILTSVEDLVGFIAVDIDLTDAKNAVNEAFDNNMAF